MRLIDQYLVRRLVPRRQLQLVSVAAMLIAAKFERSVLQECRISCTSRLIRTPVTSLLKRRFGSAALKFRISTPVAAHFLEHVGRVGRFDESQRNFAQSLIDLNLIDFYERTLVITSCVLGNDHFQLFFSRPRAQQSPRSGAYAKVATATNIRVRRRHHAERCGRYRLSPSVGVPLHNVIM